MTVTLSMNDSLRSGKNLIFKYARKKYFPMQIIRIEPNLEHNPAVMICMRNGLEEF